MRKRWIVYLAAAMLAGALGGTLLGPAPVGAVAREIVELQQSINQLIQGQKDMQTTLAQNAAVDKTLMEQSMDTVNKLTGTMMALQKTVQDMQANSGARLDTMSTQIQGISDNLQETLARMGKLNQQLADTQNAIQGIDAKLAGSAPPPTAVAPRRERPARLESLRQEDCLRYRNAADVRRRHTSRPAPRLRPTCSTPMACAT